MVVLGARRDPWASVIIKWVAEARKLGMEENFLNQSRFCQITCHALHLGAYEKSDEAGAEQADCKISKKEFPLTDFIAVARGKRSPSTCEENFSLPCQCGAPRPGEELRYSVQTLPTWRCTASTSTVDQ